jgi:hypothetical protein
MEGFLGVRSKYRRRRPRRAVRIVRMSRPRIFVLTLLAMLAFAGNSLLCRAALQAGRIDAASFTTIRVVRARSRSG